ncbi:hypothetical protein BpHYR1_001226 [Brachionus plicatilis]|uniref:Uncharacterized protein n=1 Tax=Brachionus plicatilis TaxID=10195 RepID=A0A3M7Q078_BRAPC|nr:hypothetical protein BpHYR1_001226 [Brachionus plicatilis]
MTGISRIAVVVGPGINCCAYAQGFTIKDLKKNRFLKKIELKLYEFLSEFFLSHNFDNSMLNLNLSFNFDHLIMIMNFKLPIIITLLNPKIYVGKNSANSVLLY